MQWPVHRRLEPGLHSLLTLQGAQGPATRHSSYNRLVDLGTVVDVTCITFAVAVPYLSGRRKIVLHLGQAGDWIFLPRIFLHLLFIVYAPFREDNVFDPIPVAKLLFKLGEGLV